MLTKTEETVRARGMIYKLVVQTVILYGRKIWVVTGEILKVLKGFHHRAARKITGMTAQCAEKQITGTIPSGWCAGGCRSLADEVIHSETPGPHRCASGLPSNL